MAQNNNHYRPLFLEELFVVQLYGTDEELARFDSLMKARDDFNNVVALAALIEDIKRKNLTKLNWFCCSKCQNFRICRINWYRGEKNIERNCCTYCRHYIDCYGEYCVACNLLEETAPETPVDTKPSVEPDEPANLKTPVDTKPPDKNKSPEGVSQNKAVKSGE